MGKEPAPTIPNASPAWCFLAVAASAVLGLALMADQAVRMSATYDEVTYLRVAARWWRTGEQDSITRMGSPLTFWKVQQAPTLWALDRLGFRDWVDDPMGHQASLLPIVRLGQRWIWLATLLVASEWARRLYGPRAMAMAAALCALSPNLLAHGTLATMELPIVGCFAGMFLGFWWFLKTGSRRAFWATAALGGLATSCKFTAVLIPPILGSVWAIDLWLNPDQADDPKRLSGVIRRLAGNRPDRALRDDRVRPGDGRGQPGRHRLRDDPSERQRGLAPVARRPAESDPRAPGPAGSWRRRSPRTGSDLPPRSSTSRTVGRATCWASEG